MTDQQSHDQSIDVDLRSTERISETGAPRHVREHLNSSDQELFFREIYDAHFHYVWRSLKRYGVWERELEDAAHDVFIVVHRKMGGFDLSRPIKPWLLGISFRVASDFRRRSQHRHEIVDSEKVSVDEKTKAQDEMVEVNQKRNAIYRALHVLDMDKRAVFVLHDLEEYAMPEVAEILGVPLNTCYSRLRAARKLFADAMRGNGVDGGGAT